MSSEEVWRFATGVAGNLFALGLFVSPIPTFSRIRRNKSTEQFSGLPYIVALLNCLICTWYGLPFVSSNNILVTTVNGTGAIFQLFYICIYIVYSRREARIKMLGLLLLVTSIFLAIALTTYEFMKQPLRKIFVGILSVVSLISMFASPLSIIKLVIQTKSVEFMPFYLSLSTFFMSTSFFAYGILGGDPFIFVPNGIGSILGIIQLGLYIYYNKTSRRNRETQPLLGSEIRTHSEYSAQGSKSFTI